MINVHPFPARMAPELALNALASLTVGNVVLDPMAGSGTVLQQAHALGLDAIGRDLDPLAVLISKVATTHLSLQEFDAAAAKAVAAATALNADSLKLPWLDGDEASEAFVDYWFGEEQQNDLRRLAYVLTHAEEFGLTADVADGLRVALSRIIVTKASRASLAQDTSHSRPHRVRIKSDYDVLAGFQQSVRTLRKKLAAIPDTAAIQVRRGDARELLDVATASVDMVLTSPPYLNAIDYMRGHKMSLIWLGFGLEGLRQTRSNSIGSERRPDKAFDEVAVRKIVNAMGSTSTLPTRHQAMIKRYAADLHEMLGETARVLKTGASATFVMGNSCLRGVYIRNSDGLVAAAKLAGLSKPVFWERELPSGSRYLPTPKSGALSKRMRKEVIVRLEKR